ncbi:hypothetical protein F2P81_007070 [Scophthalmus maximus]|uniref:Uncharacterized protein n=1 Tax=Scophthalmus maximus TaxID=52904 RepID=A0A6A4TG63_SCOMX|nr:hypothetical protein F2P81_007070 [Scophthalmus maximus]
MCHGDRCHNCVAHMNRTASQTQLHRLTSHINGARRSRMSPPTVAVTPTLSRVASRRVVSCRRPVSVLCSAVAFLSPRSHVVDPAR